MAELKSTVAIISPTDSNKIHFWLCNTYFLPFPIKTADTSGVPEYKFNPAAVDYFRLKEGVPFDDANPPHALNELLPYLERLPIVQEVDTPVAVQATPIQPNQEGYGIPVSVNPNDVVATNNQPAQPIGEVPAHEQIFPKPAYNTQQPPKSWEDANGTF